MIKLVIFDLDGVLVDACEWHRIALNNALLELCNYEISIENHINIYNGLPTKVKLHMLSDKGHINPTFHEKIFHLKQEKTLDIISNQGKKRNEKIELMQWLKEKKIYIACVTNSIEKTALLMLEKTGIINYLDLIITNEDVIEPKPSPEGYIKAYKHFGYSPDEVLIFEDSPKGLEAAYASNCKVVKVDNVDKVDKELLKECL